MKKIIIKLLILIYIILPINNAKALDTYSNNVILYNLNDDKIIFEKNSEEQIKIASLTKIMTAIVSLEKIENIKEKVTMPPSAYLDLDTYVKSGIKPNSIVTYEDILYGIMLPSGADCANAIAILTYGSINNFVDKMNEKAKELNLNNTHFSNPVGKDENNYSTVKDVSTLLKYALKNEEFYKIYTTREYTTTNNIRLKSTIIDKSKKDNIDASIILGSKTGFTDDAGNCLASISKINNVNYLLVTAQANHLKSYHIMDAVNIYDYYSKNYSYKNILKYNQYITTLNLNKKEYPIYSTKDIYIYTNIDTSKITYTYDGIKDITYKNKKGEKIGTIIIKYEDQILKQDDIYLDKEIKNYTYIYIITPILLIILLYIIIPKRKKHNLQKKKHLLY